MFSRGRCVHRWPEEIKELNNRIGTGASSDIELLERRRGLQAEFADIKKDKEQEEVWR